MQAGREVRKKGQFFCYEQGLGGNPAEILRRGKQERKKRIMVSAVQPKERKKSLFLLLIKSIKKMSGGIIDLIVFGPSPERGGGMKEGSSKDTYILLSGLLEMVVCGGFP